MDIDNYDFQRFVDLMAKLLEKYADKVDISDVVIDDDEEEAF